MCDRSEKYSVKAGMHLVFVLSLSVQCLKTENTELCWSHTHTYPTHTLSLHHNKLLCDALNLLPVQAIGTSRATRDSSSAVTRLQTFQASGPHRDCHSLVAGLNTDVFLTEMMNSIHQLHEVKAIPSRRDKICIWKCTSELQPHTSY